MSIINDSILKCVIKHLSDEGVTPSKVMLQKVMFYIRSSGLPLTYKFEPYLYGPYSKELSSDLSELSSNNQLLYDPAKNTYSISSNFQIDPVSIKLLESKVGELVRDFLIIINRDEDFGNIEVFGTILYCYLALKKIGVEKDKEKVLSEFASWKGNKYTKEKASPIYDRLISRWQASY